MGHSVYQWKSIIELKQDLHLIFIISCLFLTFFNQTCAIVTTLMLYRISWCGSNFRVLAPFKLKIRNERIFECVLNVFPMSFHFLFWEKIDIALFMWISFLVLSEMHVYRGSVINVILCDTCLIGSWMKSSYLWFSVQTNDKSH